MNKFIRFEISTKDRIGIAFKILEKIYEANINLHSVEVFSEKVCVKMQDMEETQKKFLKSEIFTIRDIIEVKEIELLNHEKSERKLLAVINSIDEGIMSINKNFEVEIYNDYCEQVFHYSKEEVIGKDIRRILGQDNPIVNIFKNGQNYNNIELRIGNDKGKSHFITTGRSIKDDNDKTIGAVASVKDINKAIELANVVSSTREVAFKEIVGNTLAIEKVKKVISTVSKSNSTILIRGESGTGKELFARAIRNLSDRNIKNFITINCAALPDSLIESELFGYEKGSFTGAINSGKEGLFMEANMGTIFLDEIGELSMAMQAKLLRVLQEGVIRKIGSAKEEKVDVRIIAATNKNLEEMVQEKKFREDLYYRLNVIPIYIPSLRERKEDIPILVKSFIDKLNRKLNKNISGASLEFVNILMKHNWPGNVRELQNVIERAMNLCEGNFLTLEHLIMDFHQSPNFVKSNNSLENNLSLKEVVETSEKEAIVNALEKYKSFRKAAKSLGISHTTIINKVNKYNLK